MDVLTHWSQISGGARLNAVLQTGLSGATTLASEIERVRSELSGQA